MGCRSAGGGCASRASRAPRSGVPLDALYGPSTLFHSPLGYGPLRSNARLVSHVHDLTFLQHPGVAPVPHALLPVGDDSRRGAARAARDLPLRVGGGRGRARHRREAERITVIPPPVGHDFHPVPLAEARAHVAKRFGLPEHYFLHVGTIEPRKNHARIVGRSSAQCREGFPWSARARRQGTAGGSSRSSRGSSSSERARIVRVSDASEDDLVALYGASTAVLFPSLEEGFGADPRGDGVRRATASRATAPRWPRSARASPNS